MFDRLRNLWRAQKAYGQARDLYEQPARREDPRRWADFFDTVFSITEVREMLQALQGYKTYVVAALAGLCVFGHAAGYLDDKTFDTLLALLVSAGGATIAAKINRMGKTMIVVLAASLMLPALASAQGPLTASAYRISRDYQATQAAPVTLASVAQNPRTWLRVAQASYLSSMLYDTWNACNAMRTDGTSPSNAAVPDGCNKLIAVKVPTAIGTLLASEKLWPDDSCASGCTLRQVEAIGSLVGSALLTLATPQTSPVPTPAGAPMPVSARRFALAFTIRR